MKHRYLVSPSFLCVLLLAVLGFSNSWGALDASVQQIDANNFPLVFTTVRITENGAPIGSLQQEHFTVYEDGRNQLTDFAVFPPDPNQQVRLVDFVVLVDNSGSMSTEISAVRSNIKAFADGLAARGIDYRLGAVKFGQGSGANPYIFNGGNFTDNVDIFKGWVSQMSASGGFEPGLQAVEMAAQTFTFRPGSQRHFLLVTDEDSDRGSLTNAISLCKANGITVHVAVDCNFGSSYSHYCRPETSISGATGGLVMSVNGPYNQIFDKIGEAIDNAYIVRYETDNPAYDGQQREVVIEINYESQSTSATGYYTPGAGPRIQRMEETIALSNTAHLAGTELAMRAYVNDNVAPGVQTTALYYRTKGEEPYKKIISNDPWLFWDIFQWIIPGGPTGPVQYPGVQYYITASDGQLSASDPPVDPSTEPYNIAVLPNKLPAISHTPVTAASANHAIGITCEATDNTNRIDKVVLEYQKAKGPSYSFYNKIEMAAGTGNSFSASIPANVVTDEGLRYRIRAYDDLGFYATHGPHEVEINKDSDGDGLLDIWETNGYDSDGDGVPDIDLAAMGCDPMHKDILVEADWMGEECVAVGILEFCHDDKPSEKVLNGIKKAYAEMDVPNPDGNSGINIIFALGNNGNTDSVVPHQTSIGTFFNSGTDNDLGEALTPLMDEHRDLPSNLFHYCIFAHRYCNSWSSGIASTPGNWLIVAMATLTHDNTIQPYLYLANTNRRIGTFVHEMGHNLGLRHGGFEAKPEEKPNYLSVMNYAFQFDGIYVDGKMKYWYSEAKFPSLDEFHLDETIGLNAGSEFDDYGTTWHCPGNDKKSTKSINEKINWNCDYNDGFFPTQKYETDVGTSIDENNDNTVLVGFDDLAAIDLACGGSIGNVVNTTSGVEHVTACRPRLDEDRELQPYGPSRFSLKRGFGLVRLVWMPLYDDIDSSLTYNLEKLSPAGTSDFDQLLDSVVIDSTLESATEYKFVLRSRSYYGVYSEPSDTIVHETYKFHETDKMIFGRQTKSPVSQDKTITVKFKLNDLSDESVVGAAYRVVMTPYNEPELINAIGPSRTSGSSENWCRSSYDETTQMYQCDIVLGSFPTGYWGGRVMLDDGTQHWFGIEVVPADTEYEESSTMD